MSSTASGTPAGRVPGERRRRRARLIIVALVAFAGAVALTGYALRDAINLFMLPSDFEERFASGDIGPGDPLRLGGFVAIGSYEPGEDATVRFSITDTVIELPVVFKGVLPDLFREGQGVVADGAWEGAREGGVFRATKVLAKHDENYNPPQLEDALKERGISTDGVE